MELLIAGMVLIIMSLLLVYGAYEAGKKVQKITDLNRRLKKIEDSAGDGRVRNPHLTNAGIEDAIAVLLDVLQNREVEDLRLKQASDILRQIRANPGSYDEDRPNQKGFWKGR
jgi:hypothetical protein